MEWRTAIRERDGHGRGGVRVNAAAAVRSAAVRGAAVAVRAATTAGAVLACVRSDSSAAATYQAQDATSSSYSSLAHALDRAYARRLRIRGATMWRQPLHRHLRIQLKLDQSLLFYPSRHPPSHSRQRTIRAQLHHFRLAQLPMDRQEDRADSSDEPNATATTLLGACRPNWRQGARAHGSRANVTRHRAKTQRLRIHTHIQRLCSLP